LARILMALRPAIGGAFNHVADLSAALIDRGHEVAICGPLADRAGDLQAEVIDLEIVRPVAPAQDLLATSRFARTVRGVRPDLIHAHGSKGSLVARLARPAAPRVPVVCTPHLYPFDNYFASARERALYRLVERALAPLATRVIGVCEAERRLAAQVGPAARTRLVYNGIAAVEPGPVHPLVEELREHGPVIGALAELRESKGIRTLVEAMPAVIARLPDARLAVAGKGEQQPLLERLIGELGLSDAVRLVGATEGPSPLLSGADVFVNPAWAEAFPYTILEAMSLEMPIVATDVGGSGEAIEDGVTGRLVAPRDPGALADAIVALLIDQERGRELGGAAGARYRERFTIERMVAGVRSVYAELGVASDGLL
jgi:glycosyltransferase involved in cell wall biosynthesis